MFKLYNSLIFSLIFIFGLCGFALSQVKASFSDEIATLGNTVTASIWEVVAEPDWSQMGVNTTVIQGGETYLIQNLIFNSGFENDLDSWTYGGEIKSLSAEDSLAINPKIGLMMAQIGSIDDESSLITTNFLSQELTFLDSSPQALSFWYNLVSYEHLMGFDEPAFSVYLNNDLIYQIWGEDFITESGEIPYISGWRQVILHLPANLPSSSTLTFYAGNSGDNLKPSLIFLDEITTNLILANLDSQVVLQVFSAQSLPETLKINYKYFLDGVAVSGVSDPGEFQTTFSLFSQPDDYQIEYWLSDNFEHRSISTKIPIYLDKTTPVSITDLITHLETENEITLTFTSPEDNFSNPVSDYEVRYSDQIITDLTDWQSLDLLYGQSIAPRFFGQREKLVFETPNAPGLYYLGIKSIDNMGNYSYLSNIITFTKE